MAVEIISWSNSTKGWNQAGIELATPGSATRLVTDCATRPGNNEAGLKKKSFNGSKMETCQNWKDSNHETLFPKIAIISTIKMQYLN